MLLLVISLLAACGNGAEEEGEAAMPINASPEADVSQGTPLPPPTTAPTASPLPSLTPTPQLAALVNGQPILLGDYERELARYELAQTQLSIGPTQQEGDYHTLVLDALIERELMRQAAVVLGITIPQETVERKMSELREVTGQQGGFDDWLAANLYSEEEFRNALAAELVVEQMVAVVTADVPLTMEHVHVRYIQVDDEGLAQLISGQIGEGVDFADLAKLHSLDQATAPFGGDLGWFSRGSLLVPEIEAVAFALQVDEVSDIIAVTDPDDGLTTYYIVKLLERNPNRMLGTDLRHRLLQEAFDNWLQEQIEGAAIISYLGN